MSNCGPIQPPMEHPAQAAVSYGYPSRGYSVAQAPLPVTHVMLSETLRDAILDVVDAKAQVTLANDRLAKAQDKYALAIVAYKQGVCKAAGIEWIDK